MSVFKELLGYVIDLKFDTHESMIEAALHWHIEEYQLDSGSFTGTMNAVHTSHIQIANTCRSNGVFIKGNIPPNTYLFASVKTQGHMTHNGLPILDDELIVLDSNDELDFIVSSAVDDVTIAIDKDFFDHAFKKHFNAPFEYDRIHKRVQVKENAGTIFHTSVKEMVANLKMQSMKLQNDMEFHTNVEQDILAIIFDNIDLSKERKETLESEINADKIRKYIEKNYRNDIVINELCNSKKISERTLRLGFSNLFGLSPKQYHTNYRLGKIHHAFLKGDHTVDTVEHIAYDHGFTHMGRFSKSYKLMFGNTPSHTLKKISL